MMLRVSGICRLNSVPWPGALVTLMLPPTFSRFWRTTSSPTPRPETLLTTSAVEKPGSKIRLRILSRPIALRSAAVMRPVAMALAAMRSSSSPRPSSEMTMLMVLPDWRAAMASSPISRLPPARRADGGSIPWSMALRIRWVSGSRIVSIISRSSSTSPPSRSTITCLPSSAERSRTSRGSAPNRVSIRCIRIRVMASRTSDKMVVSRSNGPSMVG